MLDPQPPSDSPVVTNLNPDDPGIHPEAAHKVEGFLALFALIAAIPGAIRRGWSWVNNTPVRRRANLALASVLLLALVAVVTGGKDVPTPPPVVTTVQGLHHVVVDDDENLASIGRPYRVTRQEMIDANIDGVVAKYTYGVCPALDRPATYFAGKLVDGKTSRDGTYCQFTEYQGTNPAYVGKKLAQDSLKKGDGVIVPCTTASTPLIQACQPQVVAQNVH